MKRLSYNLKKLLIYQSIMISLLMIILGTCCFSIYFTVQDPDMLETIISKGVIIVIILLFVISFVYVLRRYYLKEIEILIVENRDPEGFLENYLNARRGLKKKMQKEASLLVSDPAISISLKIVYYRIIKKYHTSEKILNYIKDTEDLYDLLLSYRLTDSATFKIAIVEKISNIFLMSGFSTKSLIDLDNTDMSDEELMKILALLMKGERNILEMARIISKLPHKIQNRFIDILKRILLSDYYSSILDIDRSDTLYDNLMNLLPDLHLHEPI